MKLFHLVLWQLMVVVVVAEHHLFRNKSNDQSANESRYKRNPTIPTLTLNVKINGRSKAINFVPTNQLLANEHLPVWVSTLLPSKKKYLRYPIIMREDVGHFTLYHDYVTRSAVVYFHKRRELDGIIDMMYEIRGYSIDDLHKEYIVDSWYLRLLNIWEYFEEFHPIDENSEAQIIIPYDESRIKVYPELLIAISNDMLQTFVSKSESTSLVALISHVITTYNVADMLFKFVKAGDISLNIAAIVIESDENQWGLSSATSTDRFMDATTINDQIRNLFRDKENIFRRYSFDYIVYHTRKELRDEANTIHGIADSGNLQPMFKPVTDGYRYNMAVQDHKSYEHYTTIAHELSHLFGVGHDSAVNGIFQNPRERSVMASCGVPNLCLKWSAESEEEFREFLSSPAHCILRNQPNSLLPENPRSIFTVSEQCQCYGYRSTKQELLFVRNMCRKSIQCSIRPDERGTLPFPMDGTPCLDHSRVCWNQKCVRIHETCDASRQNL